MGATDNEGKGWEQLQMLRSGPYEIILRIGAFPEADHAQFQVELRAAATHELLALSARPHVPWADARAELTDWVAKAVEHLESLDRPFG